MRAVLLPCSYGLCLRLNFNCQVRYWHVCGHAAMLRCLAQTVTCQVRPACLRSPPCIVMSSKHSFELSVQIGMFAGVPPCLFDMLQTVDS